MVWHFFQKSNTSSYFVQLRIAPSGDVRRAPRARRQGGVVGTAPAARTQIARSRSNCRSTSRARTRRASRATRCVRTSCPVTRRPCCSLRRICRSSRRSVRPAPVRRSAARAAHAAHGEHHRRLRPHAEAAHDPAEVGAPGA